MQAYEIVLIIIASIIGFIFFLSINFARFLVYPIKLRHRWVIGFEERKGLISIKWYQELNKKKIHLESKYGYKIYAELVLNDKPTDKTVIIVHGYRFNLIGSLKYGKMFLDMGYNVFWYDNCKSGNSTGRRVSMGYREKDDLGEVIKYIRQEFGENHKVGIHGESMGGALSIMYGATDEKLSFIIEDCGYSDLYEEVVHHFKTKFHIPIFPVLPIAAFFVKLFGGFKLSDVSPIRLLQEDNALEKVPMLFIHGGKDTFTPTRMGKEMYQTKKGYKELYICEDANHAQSFLLDRENYNEVIKKFLKNTNFNNGERDE